MRYRYTGPDASRNLAVSGGFIEFPRMQWVDPVKVAEETGIASYHLEIVLRGLGEDWQAEGPVKAARARKKNAKAAAAEQDEQFVDDRRADPAAVEAAFQPEGDQPETPAEPDEEQS